MDTRDAGRLGGLAKVPKGFAKMTKERKREIAKLGNAAQAKAKKKPVKKKNG
jgi:hypothetical protein